MKDDFNIKNVNPRDGMVFKEPKEQYLQHYKQLENGVRWDVEHRFESLIRHVAGGVGEDYDAAEEAAEEAIRNDGGTP